MHYFLGGNILRIEFSPKGSIFTTTRNNGDVSIFETESGKELFVIASENSRNTRPYSTFTLDGKFLAYTARDGAIIQFHDVATGKHVYTLQSPVNVFQIAFDPNGYFLAGKTYDNHLVLWRLQ